MLKDNQSYLTNGRIGVMPNVMLQDMWDKKSFEYFREHAQKHIHSKEIAIFVSIVQEMGNEGPGNDIEKDCDSFPPPDPLDFFLPHW